MQVIDKNDQVTSLVHGEREELEKRAEELRLREDVKSVLIGDLPVLDSRVMVNGLMFRVVKVLSRGRFIIKIMGKATPIKEA